MKQAFLLYIAVFIFFINDVSAQDENFLGIAVGGALPQGKFAEKEEFGEGNGYADPGFMFAFDAAWFPDDYLGIGATVTYASNNPDKKKYLEDVKNDIIMNYPLLGEFIDSNFIFDYGVWKYLNIYIGPTVTVPAGRFNFDLRVLAGLTLAWQPSQTIDAKYESGSTFSRKVDPKPVPTIGYSVGGGVRYAFQSGFVLRVMADYANSKPTFKITETTLDMEGEEIEPIITTREVAMPIKNIHVGIGIAYNFEL
jgi:opacity protein-like surface antigen